MSQSRNLGAREFALCLVILANAVWLGVTIFNAAAATPTALADVIEEDNIASFSLEKEDDPTTSVESMLTDSDGTSHQAETVTGKTTDQPSTIASQDQVTLESPDTPIEIESPSTALVLEDLQDETMVTDGMPIDTQDSPQKEGSSDQSPTVETSASDDELDLVVDELELVHLLIKRHLETSQALLKADYDELRGSGLDVFQALDYIDRMAAEDRYGEFGR